MRAAGREGFRLLRLETAALTIDGADAGERRGGAGGEAGHAATADIEIPAGSPLFAGHFPGRPVLPGIVHLVFLRRALAELTGRGEAAAGADLAEVRNLRLRRLVAPGDRLGLRVEPSGGEGGFRFELRRGADLVSQGEVRAGASHALVSDARPAAGGTPLGRRAKAPGASPISTWAVEDRPGGDEPGRKASFPPPAELLPHAPPARLLAEVLAAGPTRIVCAAVIPADYPLAGGGEVPGFVALELAAQAAAAWQTLLGKPGAGPRIGYLVGVRQAQLPATLPIRRMLRVSAVLAGAAAALTIYDVQVDIPGAGPGGGKPLAIATLSTFLPGS